MRRGMVRVAVIVAAAGYWSTAHTASQPIVRPLADLASPDRSPFPSDAFTVADARQNTGLRVNLPLPDCAVQVSDCQDVAVLNQLDGFSMQPRIWVPFDGDIDPSSVTSATAFVVKLSDASTGQPAAPVSLGINQAVWDPPTRVLSVRTDNSLDQHSRYAFVVTTGVRDANGRPIGTAGTAGGNEAYRRALAAAEPVVRRLVPRDAGIAAMSVFTTQSFSHVIQRIHEAVARAPVPTLDFAVGAGGTRAIFEAARIQGITNNADFAAGPPAPQLAAALANMRIVPGAVQTVAFGRFTALDFTTHGSGHIAPIATRTGTLPVTGSIDVAFNLYVPSGIEPPGGWPVVMFGHGSGAAKNVGFAMSAVLASHGFAVISLTAMGHGGGPRSAMTVTRTDGTSLTFAAPGSGYDADGNGAIELWEPRAAAAPHAMFGSSGPTLQTAGFYFQLVRAIQAGVDVDGDGRRDLDPSRIYYVGHSLGGMYGMFSFACEAGIRAAVFVVPAGEQMDNTRLTPGFRQLTAQALAARTPSLVNAEGLRAVDGLATSPPLFNENLPLRNLPPLVNDVPGAQAIQRFMDRRRWAGQIASTVAIASFLRRTPFERVRVRPMLIQFARSDASSANPPTVELIRAGDLADRALLYRHDLNFGGDGVPANPHLFLPSVGAPPNVSRIALGAQHQIAAFFESDGAKVTSPAPAEFWEVPVKMPLPEDTFYLPRPR